MKSILNELRGHFSAALTTLGAANVDPQVRAAADPRFGDYQCNVAMSLAKSLGEKPRDLAARIVAASQTRLGSDAWFTMQIDGPGFINIRLEQRWLDARLSALPAGPADAVHDRLGIEPAPGERRDTVVIDYSSPNVAKQMHVGHLRSTVIGDTLARVLEFLGHAVRPQNHVGDWGTQFGLLIEELRAEGRLDALLSGSAGPFGPDELEETYRNGSARMKSDVAFAVRARETVTRLQRLEPDEVGAWRRIVGLSIDQIDAVYRRLEVRLDRSHIRGESFFNPMLDGIIEELEAKLKEPVTVETPAGPLRVCCRLDQGAVCVFHEKADGSPAFKGPTGDAVPMIVRKSDGAYLYATTDLAAAALRISSAERPLRYASRRLAEAVERLEREQSAMGAAATLGGTRLLYVVGAPQRQHFEMLFPTVKALGWDRPGDGVRRVRLEHVMFGSVLGEDRKMLRTRSGENVKLVELLEEAARRAGELVAANEARRAEFGQGPLPAEDRAKIARQVGIGAVKYADLCQNRTTDYVFSWDKMLALQGNTAPYLMYAYARVCSIQRKSSDSPQGAAVCLAEPQERALGLRILRLAETLEDVGETLMPSLLCDYLYQLAAAFMVFYENCSVLGAPDAASRASRLRLSALTARTLRLGLDLLGIRAMERM